MPRRFRFHPVDDVQVLTPMHKGTVGAGNLNTELQNALNPGEGGIMRGNKNFRINDKVMQIKNNYDKEVFNGDIGKIKRIDLGNREVLIGGRALTRFVQSEVDGHQFEVMVDLDSVLGGLYPERSSNQAEGGRVEGVLELDMAVSVKFEFGPGCQLRRC